MHHIHCTLYRHYIKCVLKKILFLAYFSTTHLSVFSLFFYNIFCQRKLKKISVFEVSKSKNIIKKRLKFAIHFLRAVKKTYACMFLCSKVRHFQPFLVNRKFICQRCSVLFKIPKKDKNTMP
jgi:hypothetical protein